MSDEPLAPGYLHFEALRAFALAYPGAVESRPWGHCAPKVNNKVFVFLGCDEEYGLSITAKLPHSGDAAIEGLAYAKAAGYGLGKSGWVSASFGLHDDAPVERLKAWIDESYRSIATKTLVKTLGAPVTAPAVDAPSAAKGKAKKPAAAATAKVTVKEKAAAKKPAAKKEPATAAKKKPAAPRAKKR